MATALQFEGLPDGLDPGFQSVVNFEPPRSSDGTDYASRDHTDDQQRHAPYVSFGDGTVTATSGAFGSILRVSQYLDRPDLISRMLVLDYPHAPPPFCIVARADDLMSQAQSHRNGFGLRISQVGGDNVTEDQTAPVMTYLGDRWPRIRYSIGYGINVRVDLVCHGHMVLQRMCITNESAIKETLYLEFDPCFLLRDLDYTTPKHVPSDSKEETCDCKDDVPSDCYRGPHGRSLIKMERLSSTSRGKQLSVIVGLWKDGVSQELKDASVLSIKHDMKYRASIEYVAVFKIQNQSHDGTFAWKDFVIAGAEVNRCLRELPVESVSWEWPRAEQKHTRWSLRRNLEHILGTCSVYLPTKNLEHGLTPAEGQARPNTGVDEGRPQVSVSVENNDAPQIILETPEGDSYVIQEPDPTRFELLKINEPRKINEQQSAPSPRITEEISPETGSFSSAISLTCGDFGDHRVCISGSYFAFMFMLKMYQHARHSTLQKSQSSEWVRTQNSMRRIHETCKGHLLWLSRLANKDLFSTNLWVDGTSIPSSSDTSLPPDSPPNVPYHILKEWVYHLRATKNRLSPTWEHLQNISDIPIYRLSDQVWIWKALHDVQQLIQKVQEEKRKILLETRTTQTVRMTVGAGQASSTRALDDFLREVGPLFPSLRMRRPLSTHSLDFTVEDIRKQNIRRFTLENDVLKKRMLSVTRSARETRFLFHSRDTVLYYGKSWGFLKKDQMDIFEQLVKAQIHHDEEGVDEARWDNSLRYALALLMAQSKHQLDQSRRNEALRNPDSSDSAVEGPEGSASQRSAIPQTKKSTEIPAKVLEKAVISHEKSESGTRSEHLAVMVQRSLKRQNPHGRLVDASNIVEVPEEWLYKYPDFLDYEPPGKSDIEKIIREAQLLSGNIKNTPSDIVRQMKDDAENSSRYSYIVDVRKSRKQHKRGRLAKFEMYRFWSFHALWKYLRQPRYAFSAKKRFIYLKSIDPVRAVICYAASPESERMSLAQFFDRHGKSKPYLHDDTMVALNLWVTEVYFQYFYKLNHDQKPPGQSGLKWAMFEQLKSSGCPFYLVTAFTGFRIVGDFFDRYWTCHYVDGDIDGDTDSINDDPSHWQQRRVLELILLSRALEKVCMNTEEILEEVEREPRENQYSPLDDQYDSFEDRSPENLRECERILLLLKRNMISLREVIDQWDMRESSQGRERPRWTRRDEQKYRKSVKQKRAQLEGHVRDVRTKEIHIEFLLGRVTSAQEAIRSKKSLREAENITLFTYVTVFFLPTGLAVSIFSMGDVPSGTVVGRMVITAVVALVITVSILYGVLHRFQFLGRFWKSEKPTLGRKKATGTVKKPDDAPGRPLVQDSVSTKWSPKGWLVSLRRLDTRSLNDDPASKHV
ncbi:predicted protein [Aspergillus nidulans FGSC A4]|uniref:Uncharacterized protein n=1 Tax=Emericella nidulans (strain FGSC A4 / ATCC 38163 / CBS 112.46 / NRRL 194 / M139) TaxID=227321 RepID=Q5B642_EMENI|nr:hypothetical protein [Aspergillus nidulans FGSC A4]EAA59459.1 predicted protein [Aspergillus nidulans FGSC A4]CBF74942.1 TPA: conserved hypothetical protein [Aspergillus nidulans FGSC A4]|eukprot:XP_661592.1 predicted protein [Aspergillus nidulans FGSC A4]